jgi:GNAT superfamily N-acetyltransferase
VDDGQYGLRPADAEDLDRLVELAAMRRAAYAQFQPRFWRPAADGLIHQRGYFAELLAELDALVMVAGRGGSVDGFVIARLVPSPPVYDPGGLTCLVDDFVVAEPGQWVDLGKVLLGAARDWGASRDAVQIVVVTAHLDEPKRAALLEGGLSIASEWWVGEADQ